MRILLAGPDYEENLSIRYLLGALQQACHEATLATFNSQSDIPGVAASAADADIVGLSVCFQSRAPEFLLLAQSIKRDDPNKLIVAGGHYASCSAADLLQHHLELDVIVIHEGEAALVEIVEAAAAGRLQDSLPSIAGIAYRDRKGVVCFTPPRPMADNLDALPFPDRRGRVHFVAGVRTSYLMGSRGCYGKCGYCCITTLHELAPGKRFRQRSVENIADEMSALYHERGSRQFVFHDDNFLVPSLEKNRARMSGLASALKNRGVGEIALVVKCRPTDARQEILDELKRLGLVRVFLGIESASEQGLTALQRRQSVGESVRALETCAALDISAQFTIMAFHPAATLDTLRTDTAFLKRFCDHPQNFCRMEIYSGTPLEKQMIALGRARGNYLARDYHIGDPGAERAWSLARDLFMTRCWDGGGLMQRAIGLDHMAAVRKRFDPRARNGQLFARSARWLRQVNLDTIDLLDEVIELASAQCSDRDLGFLRALGSLREREARTREQWLAEYNTLCAELNDFSLDRRPGTSRLLLSSQSRFARQAAAAFLAFGLPTSALSAQTGTSPQQAQAQAQTGDQKLARCSIFGTVTDPSGAAVPHAKVTITDLTTKAIWSLITSSSGHYQVKDLVAGRYRIRVKASGFQAAEYTDIVLHAGDYKKKDVVLVLDYGCCEFAPAPLEPPKVEIPPTLPPEIETPPPPTPAHPAAPPADQKPVRCSLFGTVTDISGAAVANARITIVNQDTKATHSLTTDESGKYKVSELAAGMYTVRVAYPGFQVTEHINIALHAGDQKEENIVLRIAYACCETVAVPLNPSADLTLKKKPFTYFVGDTNPANTLRQIAKAVYGNENMWVQIAEMNRHVVAKPDMTIPFGASLEIPKSKRNIPKLASRVLPAYPDAAMQRGISGDVVFEVTLDPDGSVASADFIAGPPELTQSAKDAVLQWHYHAPTEHNNPNRFFVAVTFTKKGNVRAE